MGPAPAALGKLSVTLRAMTVSFREGRSVFGASVAGVKLSSGDARSPGDCTMLESPHTHVESFAALMARLDDPFADRAGVLREAGLDEATCQRLIAQWRADLEARPDGPEKL